MKLKKQVMEVLQQEITGRLKPGDELVVIGAVALDAQDFWRKIKRQCWRCAFPKGLSRICYTPGRDTVSRI